MLPETNISTPSEPVQQVEPDPTPIVKPTPKPQPVNSPKPAQKEPDLTSSPKTEKPAQEPVAPASPAIPEVMTALPQETPAPVPTAPIVQSEPPPPQSPSGPSQQDIENARSLYGSLLSRAIAKYKQYPRIAQMRGWQGEVILEVRCDDKGEVLSTEVKKSSGHHVLDEQAITMVKKASPLPQPPDILRNSKNLVILVPVPFSLEAS